MSLAADSLAQEAISVEPSTSTPKTPPGRTSQAQADSTAEPEAR